MAGVTQIWRRLTEPQAALQDRERRSQARILAAVHFPLLAVSLYFVFMPGHGLQDASQPSAIINLALLTVTLLTYGLSRTRRYQLGASLLVTAQIAYVAAILVTYPQPDMIRLLPLFLTLPILFSSIFLPLLATIAFIGLILVGYVLLPRMSGAISPTVVVDHLHYIGVISPFILLVAYLRQRDQRAVHAHAQALEESQARYRLLFEESFEALVVVADGIVIDLNPALEKLTGAPSGALLGQAETHLIRRDHTKSHAEVGAWLRRHDGIELPIEIKEKPAFYRERSVRLVSLRDLTPQLEGQRQQIELALERTRRGILQKLIRNLSHDLRTPLAVIKTSLYLVERSTSNLDKQQKHIDVVRGQVQRLQELMDDVILLARLDSEPSSVVQFEQVDVYSVMNKIVQEYTSLTEKHGLALHYVADTRLPTIDADENGLHRVLHRLLTNAVHYTPQGGRIDVTTTADETSITIRIEDTGIGIRAEDLPHIFEHFFRGDPTRNSDNGGAGLGLTIVKRLVDMHHGSIHVLSQVDVGSVFTITLPIHQESLPEPT
jgi:PAS domain S-box-containing protein